MPAKVKVTRKDNPAWKRLARGLERSVNVGIPKSETATYEDGMTVQEVAAINHEGTDDGRIPARKFIAVPLDGRTRDVRKMTERIAKGILEGRPPEPILNAYGQWAVNRVVAFINSRRYAKNAQSTIDKKGSDLPLVDDGILKSKITYQVEDKIGGDSDG
jgi:hypothetical protein